jgi:hypothetical protein
LQPGQQFRYLRGMSTATCQILHRPDLHLTVARWLSDAPLSTLQHDFEAVLQAAQQQLTGKWLLDVRRRDEVPLDLVHWTTADFFPRATDLLHPLPLRVAVLASPARMARYDESAPLQEGLEYALAPTRPYQLRLFTNEGDAMLWLLEAA